MISALVYGDGRAKASLLGCKERTGSKSCFWCDTVGKPIGSIYYFPKDQADEASLRTPSDVRLFTPLSPLSIFPPSLFASFVFYLFLPPHFSFP